MSIDNGHYNLNSVVFVFFLGSRGFLKIQITKILHVELVNSTFTFFLNLICLL